MEESDTEFQQDRSADAGPAQTRGRRSREEWHTRVSRFEESGHTGEAPCGQTVPPIWPLAVVYQGQPAGQATPLDADANITMRRQRPCWRLVNSVGFAQTCPATNRLFLGLNQ